MTLDAISRRVGRCAPAQGLVEAISCTVESLWIGATTATTAVVIAKLAGAASVALDVSAGGNIIASVERVPTGSNNVARFAITGLTADTAYTYQVRNGAGNSSGAFRTHPAAPGTPANFTVAFSGDADSGSNHVVFDAIRDKAPLMFLHLGDLHYENIGSNAPHLFQAAYDEVLSQSRQLALFSNVATDYTIDDHCYGVNNSNGTSASRAACATAYRNRVPHYPLPDAVGMWHSFDIGRVRFIVTDQRSAASLNSATDNASKTMLGAAQKAWFFDLLENSPDKLIVWVCPRHFASGTAVGHDSWGGFSTERSEIGAHVATHCPGRVVVLSADVHVLGIDDGSNRVFGGNAFPTFQAAPLDQGSNFPGDVFSEGSFGNNGQFAMMEVEDSGGSSIDVTWTGYDSTGAVLTSLSFTINL